jgi:ubiquinone/menaquinone biosynthesis C-methylase UbiE
MTTVYEDSYASWARDYDLFGEIGAVNQAERDFVRAVLVECGARTVLDCACGTGQHLIMLSNLGFELCGSDCSGPMLEVCRKNLELFRVDAETKACDYRTLESAWPQTFDAVLCLTQSLNHMLTHEDLVEALCSMRRRLEPKGVLLITQGTTHRTLESEFRFDLVVNTRDFSRVFARDIEEHFQTIHILDVFHSEERQRLEQHDIRIRIILEDEYRALLTEAGFSDVRIYGGYDRQAYDRRTSMKLIVIARP